MSLYGAVGPVDVGEVKVASHPQSTEFVCLDVRSSMVLHMSSIYCRSLFVIEKTKQNDISTAGKVFLVHVLYL